MEEIQTTNYVSDTATQLKQRLPIPLEQRYDFVFENDLAGRAALSALWSYRSQLNMYLVTEDPEERNTVAIRSALTSVRTPPAVDVISPAVANELAASQKPLVWAVLPERTSSNTQAVLQQRPSHATYLPYAEPFETLSGRYPDQSDPAHELILRDIIREHANFLNFFGDRFNPRDLYERSKYPSWINLPLDFVAAIPPITHLTVAPDGTIAQTDEFAGILELAPADVKTNYRVSVDLTPVLRSMEDSSFDLTVRLQNDYVNSQGAGALAIEVHDGEGLYRIFDIATSPPQLDVPFHDVHPGNTLSVSVVSLRDNPRVSWSVASRTKVQLAVHLPGTHLVPHWGSRAKSWLQRRIQRRQRRK